MHLPKQAKAKKVFSSLCILSVTLIALLPTFSALAAMKKPRKLPTLNAQPDPTTPPTTTTGTTPGTTPSTVPTTTTPTTTQPPNTTTNPNSPTDPNNPSGDGTGGTPGAGNDPSNRLNQPGAGGTSSTTDAAAGSSTGATNSPALLNLHSCRMVSIAPGSRVAKAGSLEAHLTVLGGSPTTVNRRFSARLAGKTKGAIKFFTASLNNKPVSSRGGKVFISPKILGTQTRGNLTFAISFANGMKRELTLKLRYWPCKRVLWIGRRGSHLRVRVATNTPLQTVSFFLPKEISLMNPKAGKVGSVLFDKKRVGLSSEPSFLTDGTLRIAQPFAKATYSKSGRSITINQFASPYKTVEIELNGTALKSKDEKWFTEDLQAYAQLRDQEGEAKITAKIKKRK